MIAHRIHSIKDKNDKHAKKYKEIIEHLYKKSGCLWRLHILHKLENKAVLSSFYAIYWS